MALSGPRLKAVNEALLDAFGLNGLDRLLFFGLDVHRERLSVGADLDEVVFAVTRELNRQERLPELVAAARAANPANVRLAEVAADLLATPLRPWQVPALERLLGGDRSRLLDAGAWHVRLGEIQRCVARVERADGRPLATAFLIGPDVALTNQHVLGREDPARIRLRFDAASHGDDEPLSAGTVHRLADDWLVDASPPSAGELGTAAEGADPASDELDFVAVRLAGAPGRAPVSALRELPDAPDRGWLHCSADDPAPAPDDPIFVLQHPGGAPLRLAFDRVLGVNRGGTRIRHGADTEPGSSGSPCFDRELRLVAIHQGGDPAWRLGDPPTFNQAVPITPIMRRLAGRADG